MKRPGGNVSQVGATGVVKNWGQDLDSGGQGTCRWVLSSVGLGIAHLSPVISLVPGDTL